MIPTEIFVKTDAGTDEVKARSRMLAPRLRTMLIMVDGTLSASQLQDAAATLGAPQNFLQALLEQGLIRQLEAAQAADQSASPQVVESASVLAIADRPDISPSVTGSALSDPERFRAAQKLMNDSAVDGLGFRAFFFTLKLEKCFSCDDLRRVLPEFNKAMAKASGPDKASALTLRVSAILWAETVPLQAD